MSISWVGNKRKTTVSKQAATQTRACSSPFLCAASLILYGLQHPLAAEHAQWTVRDTLFLWQLQLSVLHAFPSDLQPQFMTSMRPWGAGRPVTTQGGEIPPFTSQPNWCPPLEVLADQLPPVTSFENVLCEHGDNRFASVSGNAMMRIAFPVFPVTCLTHHGS